MHRNNGPRIASAILGGVALCLLSASAAHAADAPADTAADTAAASADMTQTATGGMGSSRAIGELAPLNGGGRLLLTGGVSTIEGAAGGGLSPWALIGGYGTKNEFGLTAFATGVTSQDFRLYAYGAAANIGNRLELSLARQNFHLRGVGKAIGLGNDFVISQTIVGAKVRLFGNAVLDQDSLLPQVSVGAQYKINDDKTVVGGALGVKRKGVDFYASATKIFLGQSLLVNGTVRLTKANQYGILGFGGLGGKDQAYKPQFEGSVAYLLTRKLAVGGEVRTKANRLEGALGGTTFKEEAAFDAFAAYTLNRHVSLTAAYVRLGQIALRRQDAAYLSLQVGF